MVRLFAIEKAKNTRRENNPGYSTNLHPNYDSQVEN